jgi:hypothetical protein
MYLTGGRLLEPEVDGLNLTDPHRQYEDDRVAWRPSDHF